MKNVKIDICLGPATNYNHYAMMLINVKEIAKDVYDNVYNRKIIRVTKIRTAMYYL